MYVDPQGGVHEFRRVVFGVTVFCAPCYRETSTQPLFGVLQDCILAAPFRKGVSGAFDQLHAEAAITF
jgi:hypothetical protein